MKKLILLTWCFLLFLCGVSAQKATRAQLMGLFNLANKYQTAGDYNGAIQTYLKIVELAPGLPEPCLALGFLYSEKEDDKSAILSLQYYKKYINLAPYNAERDSIARIVSNMEKSLSSPENDIDDTFIELSAENISTVNRLNDNPPEPIISKRDNSNPKEKHLFDGKWISDKFVQSTMIPEWVFDISGSGHEYIIRFHRASQRYSDRLDSKEKKAIYVNDTCLIVSFALSVEETGDSPDHRTTTDSLTLIFLSKDELLVKCKETTEIQRFGEGTVKGGNFFETTFYKIPGDEDMTFIMLGKDNYLITNYPSTDAQPYKTLKALIKNYRKQANSQTPVAISDPNLYFHLAGIDSLGYCQWYSKKETKNLLKTIGNGLIEIAIATLSAVTANQFSVVNTYGGMIVQWLKESASSKSADSALIVNKNINNSMKVNPLEWNTKMYNSLSDYYKNNKNIIIQTAH